MIQEQIIQQIKKEAKKYFRDACPSHDWSHVERVYNLCLHIGKKEGADLYILQITALLHDIGRKEEMKNPNGLDHAEISANLASHLLDRYNLDGEIKEAVLHCINSHRFRKNKKLNTLEAKVLFDADKLDSIGAIGVARAYAWTGRQNIKLYSDKTFLGTGYEPGHSPVTEFRFKLSKVKDRLFTNTARKIAESRHKTMEEFFEQIKQGVEM